GGRRGRAGAPRGRGRRGGVRRGRRLRRRRAARACGPRPSGGRVARAGEALLLGGDGAAYGRRLPRAAKMKVAAIVVSHGNAADLEQSLPALEQQVDELLVIANVPGSVPLGVEALVNERPLGF